MHSVDQLCEVFKYKKDDILNIYLYGSRVYETHQPDSDHDYIVVFKSAMLPSGAFKENAKSNEDRTIQIIPYSRGGFKAGLEQFDISCIECLYLPTNMVIQKKWPFKLEKINAKEFANKIISKVSASWHSAGLALNDGHYYHAKKGYYHAIRIADFALQLKNSNFESIDFNTAKIYWNEISKVNDDELKHYVKHKMYAFRDQMFDDLRA